VLYYVDAFVCMCAVLSFLFFIIFSLSVKQKGLSIASEGMQAAWVANEVNKAQKMKKLKEEQGKNTAATAGVDATSSTSGSSTAAGAGAGAGASAGMYYNCYVVVAAAAALLLLCLFVTTCHLVHLESNPGFWYRNVYFLIPILFPFFCFTAC
jgi:hypothetical protein